MKAHDGEMLWGLVSYPSFFKGRRPCCIRAAGPTDPIQLDPAAVESGTIEIHYQAPAGRRLEDRVLDLLHIYAQALRQPTVNDSEVRFDGQIETRHAGQTQSTSKNCTPTHGDEVWIARRILPLVGNSCDQ